jgi:hypothetical protein
MGAAKQRGTREERIAQAVERDREAKEARIAAERARWEALTPEQREAERAAEARARRRILEMHAMAAMAAGAAAPRFPR